MWLWIIACRLFVMRWSRLISSTKSGDVRPDPRIGGRFWVLAGDDEDEEDDVEDFSLEKCKAPATTVAVKPSGVVSSPVHSRKSEAPKKPPPLVKPWIGPIRKVSRAQRPLSDFLPETWTIVTKKKKGKKGRPSVPPPPPPVARAADEIRTARRVCLNSLLGQKGRSSVSVVVGSVETGYMARFETQSTKPVTSSAAMLHVASDCEPSPDHSIPSSRVFRRPGFPSLGVHQAAQIKCGAGVLLPSMAG